MPDTVATHRWSWRRTVLGACLFLAGAVAGGWGWSHLSVSKDPGLEAVIEAWQVAKMAYVQPVDSARLRDGALQGMAASLDPHSEWWAPKDQERIMDQLKGQYGGVGIRFRWVPDGAMLVSVQPGGPGDKAGLRKGDVIVAINGHPARVDTTTVNDWRGKPGSVVVMTVERTVNHRPHREEITLKRAVIRNFGTEDEAVRMNAHDGAWIRVRVQEFQESTVDEVAAALRQHWAQEQAAGRTPSGLVLDLRGSPGGLVPTAVGLASLFMGPNQTVVSVHERYGITTMRTLAFPPEAWSAWAKKAPIVVWTDRGTASAAELLVAALRDHRRTAWIIGETTFGKGSVQTAIPLDQGGDFKLTTGLYASPAGHYLQGVGETPDVLLVPTHPLDVRRLPAEKNLPGALPSPQQTVIPKPRATVTLPDNAWTDSEVSSDWFWSVTRDALGQAPSVVDWHGTTFPSPVLWARNSTP